MAEYDFKTLKNKYDDFLEPVIIVEINGKNIDKSNGDFMIADIENELTSGFEASVLSFHIYNSFDKANSVFRYEALKSFIYLGSPVSLALGYAGIVKRVFLGFIARVNFVYDRNVIPYVKVTAMDVKGIMMSNNYARQLKANSFSDAVKEILDKTNYDKLRSQNIITKLDITATPDKRDSEAADRKASAETIEMVCESDYEFVVKAAKKFNYEFFTEVGTVHFRKAKVNREVLLELAADRGIRFFDLEYDVTGLVQTIEARGMDVGRGKLIRSNEKFSNKISMGNKAMPLLKKTARVYIDPTINSQEDADRRVRSLMEDMSYRFGTLECECIGLPEIVPGRFLTIEGCGTPLDNRFYVVNVTHIMDDERGFITKIKAKTDAIEQSAELPALGSIF